MKLLKHSDEVKIPRGVAVHVKARKISVKGPRGTLKRDFTHANLDMYLAGDKKHRKLVVDMWFGTRKEIACVRTVCSHVENMIVGVTKGFEYKMRYVYAHFPINSSISEDGSEIKINNFLGEKIQRVCTMLSGVKVSRSEKVKDEIILTGNDLEKVSNCAAQIHASTLVKGKDIRKFLDGIYVSERNILGQ
eukprot:TRINITY_DN18128_c0_g1_i1.p1 TRINITY_DN18128_c0_g1~~TRINITY_DN18128_c0_g1_i1.p1  ORF type:complete len:209 (-),score=53.15 TRINITY_DN18128_c0_g1_i1:104-676(-)